MCVRRAGVFGVWSGAEANGGMKCGEMCQLQFQCAFVMFDPFYEVVFMLFVRRNESLRR